MARLYDINPKTEKQDGSMSIVQGNNGDVAAERQPEAPSILKQGEEEAAVSNNEDATSDNDRPIRMSIRLW